MNKYLQVKCANLGMNIKDIVLIYYIRDNILYQDTFKTSDIIEDNLATFRDAGDVKDSIKRVEDAEIWTMTEWNMGKFKLEINRDNLKSLFQIEDKIIIKPKAERGKQNKIILPDDVQKILDYYQKNDFLPKCISLNDRRLTAIKGALENHSVDDIIDALKYASEQKWTRNKLDAPWYDITWLMRNIISFMPGGKYRQQETKQNMLSESEVKIII